MPLGREVAEHSDAVDDSLPARSLPGRGAARVVAGPAERLARHETPAAGPDRASGRDADRHGDVRITTRYSETRIRSPCSAPCTSSGTPCMRNGIDPALERTPLATLTSLGLHESQSRIWENLVGRSRRSGGFFYPRLQETFPHQLGGHRRRDVLPRGQQGRSRR